MGEVPLLLLVLLVLLELLLWLRKLFQHWGFATFALPKLGLDALGAALLWACLWGVLSVCVILL